MGCEIKNEKCPFQIQCLFPTAANDTGAFALYFNPSQGSPGEDSVFKRHVTCYSIQHGFVLKQLKIERKQPCEDFTDVIADTDIISDTAANDTFPQRVFYCGYNGNYYCYGDKGFKETHDGFNNVNITVPDTFATRKGFFECQKGGIPMVKTCSYHPPEICGLETTTKGINSSLTTEQFGNQDNSQAILIAAILVPTVIVLMIIIGCLMSRSKRCKGYIKCNTNNGAPSDVTIRKREKSSRGKKTTGNHVEQSPIDHASHSMTKKPWGWRKLINCDNALTVNEKTTNVNQGHPSTGYRTNGASSEIQPTLSSSGNSTPSPWSA